MAMHRMATGTMPRRQFLTTSALACAGLGLGGLGLDVRTLSAAQVKQHVGRHAANALLEAPLAPAQLRQLAAAALEAATRAGAQYADVRVAHAQSLYVSLDTTGAPLIQLWSALSYGVRAMVNGAMAFDYGMIPTADAVAAIARQAVTQAKGFSVLSTERSTDRTELAPAPVVQGEWQSPMEIDPFTVPILEQADLLGAYGAANRAEGGADGYNFTWERETRVCATTEGTQTTQTFVRAEPLLAMAGVWLGSVDLALPDFGPRLAGYEYVMQPGLHERIKAYIETCVRYARLRAKPLDIGRYPVVFDGHSTASLVNCTLGPAVQMDRVLGFEADASGGSFLAPHNEILDTPLFSPLLSVAASRPLTDITGAKWDDDGVAPREVTVIDQGRVVDYLTDRQTAPALTAWYDRRHQPVQSHGFAVARRADRPGLVGTGHLDMRPASGSASLEELVRPLTHGILVIQVPDVRTDQQLASGFVASGSGARGLLLEVKHGQVTNRIKNAGLQFRTTPLWKHLDAVGDHTTLGSGAAWLSKGQPWQGVWATSTAPAIRCAAIDVIQMNG